MQQVRVHGPDEVTLDEVPEPECGPVDVIVAVSACGICGSDLNYISMGGLTAPGVPMPLGHELSGTVVEVGAEVTTVQPGARVVVHPMANGRSIGNGGAEGGLAPLLRVADVAAHPGAVLDLPEGLSDAEGALVEPLSVGLHAIHRSGAAEGDRVVVMGAGPIGLGTVALLAHRGVEDIVVADLSDFRLDLARRLGASTVLNPSVDDVAATIIEAHGAAEFFGMPLPDSDVWIEATGSGRVLEDILSWARHDAMVTVVGLHSGPIQLDPVMLLAKELRISGAMAYPEEFPEVIDILSSGELDMGPLVTHRFPLSEAPAALERAADAESAAKVLVDCRSVSERPAASSPTEKRDNEP